MADDTTNNESVSGIPGGTGGPTVGPEIPVTPGGGSGGSVDVGDAEMAQQPKDLTLPESAIRSTWWCRWTIRAATPTMPASMRECSWRSPTPSSSTI